MARVFIPSEEALLSYYNHFWAAPGMPEFLLGTELSTSRKHVPGEFRGRDECGRFPEDYDIDEDFGEGQSMAGRGGDMLCFAALCRRICKAKCSKVKSCTV